MAHPDHRADTVARLTGLLEVTRLVRSEQDLDALLPAIATAVARRWATAPWSSRSTGRPGTTSASRPSTAPTRAARRCSGASARGPNGSRSSTCASSATAASCCRGTSSTGPGTSRSTSSPTSRWPTAPTPGIPRTRSSCRCATARGTCSASCPSTSRSPGAGRPTTTSRCSRAGRPRRPGGAGRAGRGAEAARHRTALEHLLRVSAALTETLAIDAIMQEVC